jgi:hypothetical protein
MNSFFPDKVLEDFFVLTFLFLIFSLNINLFEENIFTEEQINRTKKKIPFRHNLMEEKVISYFHQNIQTDRDNAWTIKKFPFKISEIEYNKEMIIDD